MTLHRTHLVEIGTSAIDGISAQDIQDGLVISRPISDGLADPRASLLTEHKPVFRYSSYALAVALAECGWTGSRETVIVYDAKMDVGGAKAGSTNHVKSTITEALTVVRQITCRGREMAMISLETMGYSSSGGAPITTAASSALPADTISADEYFGIGEVNVNGTTLASVSSITVDTGIEVTNEVGDGRVADLDIRIFRRVPIITVTTNDPAARATVTASGVAISSTTNVVFQKRAAGGSYVSSATGEHVSVTASSGMVIPVGTSGEPREFTFQILPDFDGTNASLLIATDATF